MPVTLITSAVTGTQTATGDTVLILTGNGSILSGGAAILSQHDGSLDLALDGLVSGRGAVLDLGFDATSGAMLSVQVGPGGVILAEGSAVYLRRSGAGIVNDGQIQATGEALVFAAGATSGRLQNGGTLRSTQGTAVQFLGAEDGAAADARVRNDGRIEAQGTAIAAQFEHLQVVNAGWIGGGFCGVWLLATEADAALILVNSGTVSGAVAAVLGGSNGDTLRNSGTVQGLVGLDQGDDRLVNGGLILGDVDLGEGDDRYFGGTGQVTGLVAGGAGQDTILGGAGDETLQGGTGNDRLRGGDGEDVLAGQSGDDHLGGEGGDDDLDGSGGNDALYGGRGADVLRGGQGNDTMQGGDGDDLLYGGTGRDILTGNAGADLFVYFAPSNSTVADPDTIRDFTRGEDRIDLDELSPGDLVFAGAGAFAGGGTASLRLTTSAPGNTQVRIDTDGDGVEDMLIHLRGITGLQATDFVL